MKHPIKPNTNVKALDRGILHYEQKLSLYRKRVALIGIFAGILIVIMLMNQIGFNKYQESNICVSNSHSGMYYALDGKTITIVLDQKNPQHRQIAQQVAEQLKR